MGHPLVGSQLRTKIAEARDRADRRRVNGTPKPIAAETYKRMAASAQRRGARQRFERRMAETRAWLESVRREEEEERLAAEDPFRVRTMFDLFRDHNLLVDHEPPCVEYRTGLADVRTYGDAFGQLVLGSQQRAEPALRHTYRRAA